METSAIKHGLPAYHPPLRFLQHNQKLFTNLVLAYGLVFVIQGVAMSLAVWFLSRVNMQEFRTNAKLTITSVLESELD